jgi:hypothetical protein
VPADEVDRALVRDRWLKVIIEFWPVAYDMLNMRKDKSNLKSVEDVAGKSFKADPKENVVDAYPVQRQGGWVSVWRETRLS